MFLKGIEVPYRYNCALKFLALKKQKIPEILGRNQSLHALCLLMLYVQYIFLVAVLAVDSGFVSLSAANRELVG